MARNLGPLGLQPTFVATDAQLAKLATLERWDLRIPKAAASRAAHRAGEEINIELLERELKRFLALGVLIPEPDYPLVPSKRIDALWHDFILDTRSYMTLCNEVYGRYFHHDPSETRDLGEAKAAGEPFAYTKEIMTQAFGALPPDVWGNSARCDHGAGCCWI